MPPIRLISHRPIAVEAKLQSDAVPIDVQSFRLKAYIDAAKCRVVQDHLAVFDARTKPFVDKQSEIFKLLPSCFTPTCLEFSPPVWLGWVAIIRFSRADRTPSPCRKYKEIHRSPNGPPASCDQLWRKWSNPSATTSGHERNG
jgi:hypothetical protein